MSIGIFEDHRDIGTLLHEGSATHDPQKDSYAIRGSGLNMWAAQDAFHFLWKRLSGDFALTATIEFVGEGVEPHRKACLLVRQSLDADAAYADVALHGDGLTSLQFRTTQGATTHEVQANVWGPKSIRLERRGNYVRLYSGEGETLSYSGAAVRLDLQGDFYIGLGVCAHNADVIEEAFFSHVNLQTTFGEASPVLYSALEMQSVGSTDRRVCYVTPTLIEAPNWFPDGKNLLYNSGGLLYRISTEGGTPEQIDTGFATRCNNDHGISPDGTTLVISDQSQGDHQSLIYTLPITGRTPTLITPQSPSYWHGWSPDGKTLAYCAQREGAFNIYTIPAIGGAETRLTSTRGLDDGPEYSPDGAFIYFNSDRTGLMQIWRMKTDGSEQKQVTFDTYNNWFAHPAPDGRYITLLSYEPEVKGHPANKEVQIRLMELVTGNVRVLARIFGGQGTINVPCWSPDSRNIAFVTYQFVP